MNKLITKSIESQEVYVVGSMGIDRVAVRLYFEGVVVQDVKNVRALMGIGSDDPRVDWNIVGHKRIWPNGNIAVFLRTVFPFYILTGNFQLFCSKNRDF